MLYLLTRFILLAFREKKNAPSSIMCAALGALAIATVAGAYGFADGREPDFGAALLRYLIPTLLAMSIELVRIKLRRQG